MTKRFREVCPWLSDCMFMGDQKMERRSGAEWFERSVRLCGCGKELARNTLRFALAHDTKIEGLFARGVERRKHRDEVPAIARAMKNHIKFLEGNPLSRKRSDRGSPSVPSIGRVST